MKNIHDGVWCAIISLILVSFFGTASAFTLEEVKKRGEIRCGVSTGVPGFSNTDEKGEWSGLDVDFCRALAAATMGDKSRVSFLPLSDKERVNALYSGEVDVLVHSTPWNLTNETALGFRFAGVSYFDGQGFMVMKKKGIKSALELDGMEICIPPDPVDELKTKKFCSLNRIDCKEVLSENREEMVKKFETDRCDAVTGLQSRLYVLRSKLSEPDNVMVLPDIITKFPLGPVVRQGDENWLNIVRWTLFALIHGEELGVTSTNIEELKQTEDPDIKRLLGQEGIGGKGLGLPDNWAYLVISQVGNYGELFERNLGSGALLNIDRGVNELWNRGGILYAPPLR